MILNFQSPSFFNRSVRVNPTDWNGEPVTPAYEAILHNFYGTTEGTVMAVVETHEGKIRCVPAHEVVMLTPTGDLLAELLNRPVSKPALSFEQQVRFIVRSRVERILARLNELKNKYPKGRGGGSVVADPGLIADLHAELSLIAEELKVGQQ
jgi:hypothetical protein